MKPVLEDNRDLLFSNESGAQDSSCLLPDLDCFGSFPSVCDELPLTRNETLDVPAETSSPLSWRDIAGILFDSDIIDL